MRYVLLVTWLGGLLAGCPRPPETATPGETAAGETTTGTPADPLVAAYADRTGAWATTGEAMAGPEGPMVPYTASESCWFDDDGATLLSHYAQPPSEESPGMEGWGKMWFDAEAGVVRMRWTDSMMMPGVWMEGEGSFQEDGALVIDADMVGEDGAPMHFRMVTRFPAPDSQEFEMAIVMPDGTAAPMMRGTSTLAGPADETWAPPEPPMTDDASLPETGIFEIPSE